MKKKRLLSVIFILITCFIVYYVLSTAELSSQQKEATLTEIFSADRNPQVESILEGMTPEQKVGQLFMGCFYEGTPSPETVAQYHLGGVLLFGASFSETPKETLTASLDAIDYTSTISPIIAVDEEGGDVVRVSASKLYRSEPFKSPRELFAQGGMEAIIADTHEKTKLLSEIGVDMNLAPVCDISLDPADFMYARSLGQDAQTTSLYTANVVKAYLDDDMACSLKHFPGYGNTADTHHDLAVDTRPLEALQQNDFLPFQVGIDEGAPSVLISHTIVPAIDKNLPSSLSPAVHRILREDMNFDGVIITDDLSMGAITKFSSGYNNAVTAVLAGNDMLCTGDFANQYAAVLNALNSGVISEERIDSSVRRILELKLGLGLLPSSE